MMGGWMLGGRLRSTLCEVAVSWATPVGRSAFGWKYTLMTVTPNIDCDSMCSTSLTVVE
jgi:hypothetical protein